MEIRNPILPGFHPDPSACRVGDWYYVATSTFEWWPGVRIHRSRDLVHWEHAAYALTRLSQIDLRCNPPSGGVWAPALSYADDQFWLIYSDVKNFSDQEKDVTNYLITAPSIEGPWSDPVTLNRSGFDPSLFHDTDGRKWLLNQAWDYRREGIAAFDGIIVQEYDPVAQKLIGPVSKIFQGSSLGVTEGPHLIKRGNWYYLLTAEGGTVWEHAVTIARSRSLFGPYELSPYHPLITSSEAPEVALQKAGHGSIVQGPDGQWWLFHLCGRPVDGVRGRCMLGRETSLQALDWPEGGWPKLRHVGNTPAETVTVSDNCGNASDYRPNFSDSFEGNTLGAEWNTLREPPTSDWLTLKERPGWLRLRGRNSLRSRSAVSLAAVRVTHMECRVRVKIDFQPQNWRQRSGLVLYYDDAHHIALQLSGTDEAGRFLCIYHCDQGRQQLMRGTHTLLPDTGELELEAFLSYGGLQFCWRMLDGDWQDVGHPIDATIISDDRVWESVNFGFTGAYWGLYAADSGDSEVPSDFTQFTVQGLLGEQRGNPGLCSGLLGHARRVEWSQWAALLAEPVLTSWSRGTLSDDLPIEAQDPEDRKPYVQLEIIARLLSGLAPWLALTEDGSKEGILRKRFKTMALEGFERIANENSTHSLNFTKGDQPLVDAAFLAQAFLRAPDAIWLSLSKPARQHLIEGFLSTRKIVPYENNWWLFAAIIEAFFAYTGEVGVDEERLATALNKHESWYKGDGAWGDGPEFHWDYYNSFVIQPMLVDVLAVFGREAPWASYNQKIKPRLARYLEVQERMIGPDGSFPALGRSLAYRSGAFHALAQAALRQDLPDSITPGQVRVALTRVLRRTLDAPGTFDANGWLRIGLAGHQPSLAERYISTSSLYLCTAALLPLGLPTEAPFWTEPDQPITSDLAWGGTDLRADKAYSQPC